MQSGVPSTPVEERIQRAFEGLSPQLRIAARFIVQHPDDVALLSMRSLAAKAGVSASVMLRLAKRLGADDYNSFRDEFKERLRGQAPPRPFTTRARQLQSQRQRGETLGLVNEVLELDQTNLRATFANLDLATIESCVVDIERASRVFVIGRRSCYPVAYGFHYAYQMFRRNGHLVEERGGNFGNDFAAIGSADVLIGISFDPYSRQVVSALRHAAQRGAVVVAITDNLVSPLARCASHCLMVANASPGLLQSITAATALVQAIIALLLARAGDQAVQELEAMEAHLGALGAYWDDRVEAGRVP